MKKEIEIKQHPYCGPVYMPKKLRNVISKSFNTPCKNHDKDYEEKKLTRKEADKKFLKGMKIEAENNIFKNVLAYTFYGFVRAFGWLSYRKSKKT